MTLKHHATFSWATLMDHPKVADRSDAGNIQAMAKRSIGMLDAARQSLDVLSQMDGLVGETQR